MKSIIKKSTCILISLISTFSLTSCFQYNTRVVLDDVIYYLHDYKNIAYSVGVDYDVGMRTEYEIKDVVDGHIVNRLGDCHGHPYHFGVSILPYLEKTEHFPGLSERDYNFGIYVIRYTDDEQKKNMAKEYYKIKYFDFILKFGANLESICVISYCADLRVNDKEYGYIPRYRIECNPDNKTFYSEDGKLYRRENKELVTDFIYYDYQIQTS